MTHNTCSKCFTPNLHLRCRTINAGSFRKLYQGHTVPSRMIGTLDERRKYGPNIQVLRLCDLVAPCACQVYKKSTV